MTRIETTAGRLAWALWGCRARDVVPEASDVSERGSLVYRGTTSPVRLVPEDAPVTLVVVSGGGYVEAASWIADRFGRLGVREVARAVGQLGRRLED